MAAPLTTLFHCVYVVSEIAVLVFVQKWLEKLLMSYHVLASLLSHDVLGILSAVDLVGKSPKQAVAVTPDVSQLDSAGSELLVEVSEVLEIDLGELEGVALGHLLAQFHFGLLVRLSLQSGLLYHLLLVFLLPHPANSFIIILFIL